MVGKSSIHASPGEDDDEKKSELNITSAFGLFAE